MRTTAISRRLLCLSTMLLFEVCANFTSRKASKSWEECLTQQHVTARALSGMRGRTKGVCSRLLDPAPPPDALGIGLDHVAIENKREDIADMYVPTVDPCAPFEMLSHDLLLYRHCAELQKTRKTACPELNQPLSAQQIEAASNTELSQAKADCMQRSLAPCAFYGQMHEDAVLYNMFFKHHFNGIYLEMGALDGQTYSNTLFFQQTLNWSGVLIEPGPKFSELVVNRGGARNNNVLHNLAVCDTPGEMTFRFVKGVEAEGGIQAPERTWNKEVEEVPVKCDRLGQILRASGVKWIDLFSLDVEGFELQVLESMDWDIPFNVLIMEQNKCSRQVEKLLLSKGYEYVREQRGNAIWARTTFDPSTTLAAGPWGRREAGSWAMPIQLAPNSDPRGITLQTRVPWAWSASFAGAAVSVFAFCYLLVGSGSMPELCRPAEWRRVAVPVLVLAVLTLCAVALSFQLKATHESLSPRSTSIEQNFDAFVLQAI
jgi:FkbM family methyltransferase